MSDHPDKARTFAPISLSILNRVTGYRATILLGAIRHVDTGAMIASPADRARWFLKGLKAKVHKPHCDHHDLGDQPPWKPLYCGPDMDMRDDFRPFLGKTLRRVDGAAGVWAYEEVVS